MEAGESMHSVEHGIADNAPNILSEPQKGLAELLPASEEESNLWKYIEDADPPIRTTLKRLNRIAKAKFPRCKLQTVSSCSGHVKEDGSLAAFRGPIPELKLLPYYPDIMFYTRSRTHLLEMTTYLRGIFGQAVSRVNEKLQEDIITMNEDTKYSPRVSFVDGVYCTVFSEELAKKHPSIKTYSMSYEFPVLRQENAFPVIEQFWTELGLVLTEIDGLNLHSFFEKKDFIKKKGEY